MYRRSKVRQIAVICRTSQKRALKTSLQEEIATCKLYVALFLCLLPNLHNILVIKVVKRQKTQTNVQFVASISATKRASHHILVCPRCLNLLRQMQINSFL